MAEAVDLELELAAKEHEDSKKQYHDEYELVAYGRYCPEELVNQLTPMEFEEIVLMFNKYDVDNSDSIDKHEARKILFDLGLDFGLEKAEELFNIIDEIAMGSAMGAGAVDGYPAAPIKRKRFKKGIIKK
jgi:hypothetical protein